MDGKLVILAGGISSRMKKPSAVLGEIDSRLIEDAEQKSKSMIGVGNEHRPFLDYLLFNARQSGYIDIVIVIGERDNSIKKYYGEMQSNNDFKGLKISYAVQPIPEGREKPLGTADALYYALKSKPEWKGKSFTLCNSDNLYSVKALKCMLESEYPNAMIDYDREGFEFSKERIAAYAITKKDDTGFIIDIIEKPSGQEINFVLERDQYVGVSMNIFKLNYDMIMPYLIDVPLHPLRKEKELPMAVVMMIRKNSGCLYAYPFKEHVPDLTNKEDIIPVQQYLKKEFADFNF